MFFVEIRYRGKSLQDISNSHFQLCFHHDTYCVSRYNNKETIHTERACDLEENMRVLRFQFR